MTPKADFIIGIVIFSFAAMMFNIARGMPAPSTFGLGPGGYPMLVTGVLMLLGVILAIQGLLGVRRLAAKAAEGNPPEKKALTLAEFKNIIILAASFWAYLTVMRHLGYLISTPIFLFLFLFLYGHRKWLQMILISLITTGLTWVLFNHAFLIILPDLHF